MKTEAILCVFVLLWMSTCSQTEKEAPKEEGMVGMDERDLLPSSGDLLAEDAIEFEVTGKTLPYLTDSPGFNLSHLVTAYPLDLHHARSFHIITSGTDNRASRFRYLCLNKDVSDPK